MMRHAGFAAALAVLILGATHVAAADNASFVSGPMPAAPGLGLQRNQDNEPEIAVDGGGTIWAAAAIADAHTSRNINPGVASGSDIWRSTDGGTTFQWVANPFDATGLDRLPGQAGFDSDIAAAQTRNALGFYNVYAVSFSVGFISIALSPDGGRHWIVDPVGGTVPDVDRPWIAADGPCVLYLAYHQTDILTTVVDKYDLCSAPDLVGGQTLDPIGSSRLVALAPSMVRNRPAPYVTVGFGKIVVDTSAGSPFAHRVYIPMMDCGDLTFTAELGRAAAHNPNCPGKSQVVMAVSSDGGRTWALHHVAQSTNSAVPMWPVTSAVDAAGRVYIAWFDNRNAYIDASSDGGTSWTAPLRVNTAPSLAAVLPTLAAGRAGSVDIAWYGTSVAGDANDLSVMGPAGGRGSAPWTLYLARSTDGGKTLAQVAVTGPVHKGVVCTQGTACDQLALPFAQIAGNNTRDLFENFGMVINPQTERVSIDYTSDQPEGDLAHDFVGYATETTATVKSVAVRAASAPPRAVGLPSTGAASRTVSAIELLFLLACTAGARLGPGRRSR